MGAVGPLIVPVSAGRAVPASRSAAAIFSLPSGEELGVGCCAKRIRHGSGNMLAFGDHPTPRGCRRVALP